MNAQKLSFAFLFYGILLLAAAGLCFWVNHYGHAGWLGISALGMLFWSHFFNRRHFWGFQGLLAQLFVLAGISGWVVLTNFLQQPEFTHGQFSLNGFMLFSGIFLLNVSFLFLATKMADRVKRELQ